MFVMSTSDLDRAYEFGWMRDSGAIYVMALAKTFGGRLNSEQALREFFDLADHPAGIYLATTKDGPPVAYCASRVMGRHTIRVEDLLVAPAHRRKGLARRILGSLLKQEITSEVRTVVMEVEEHHTDLLLFLRSLGFKWLKTYKDPGGDTYLMSWTKPDRKPPAAPRRP